MPLTHGQTASRIPTQVTRQKDGEQNVGTGLTLNWSDGSVSTLSSKTLRENCPCATCLEARGDTSHHKPLAGRSALLNVISATVEEETNLQQVWPVGNYALGMRWGDGHDSGIYTYAYLGELQSEEA